ncbi:MAG: prepilin-type N-terminal cleavage/methylation domain-containing protein [Nitrospirae bacterium]|nr:prepilin-type N-terminal cleavage/methylation domain-containing protein [Nitrospirota bacterium]
MLIRTDERGFTLIEIIAVLILMGIVAVVVAAKYSSPDVYAVSSELETLKTNLRFAQLKAMNELDGTTWGIKFSATSNAVSYALIKTTGGVQSSPVLLPGDSTATHTLTSGITATTTVNPIVFDNWGSPGTASITIGLTNSAFSPSATVTKNTGFIS